MSHTIFTATPLVQVMPADSVATMRLQAATDSVKARVDSLAHVFTNPDSLSSLTPRRVVDSLAHYDWSVVVTNLSTQVVGLMFRLLAAIVIFYIGRFIINKLYKLARAIMVSHHFDRSLTTFLLSVIKITLLFVLVVTVIGVLGIETSSFIALFASAGVAIGMALSGTLQNFAGGVLLLLLKPYKVGDYIEFGTYKGTVQEIQIFHTVITTPANDRIVIPNGNLSSGTINNFSGERYHRLQWSVSVSYGDDVELARQVVLEILHRQACVVREAPEDAETAELMPTAVDEQDDGGLRWWQRVLRCGKRRAAQGGQAHDKELVRHVPKKDFTPQVLVDKLGESSVDLIVRAWCATADYWTVYYAVNEQIYKELPRRGLHFPYPQLDVHLSSES